MGQNEDTFGDYPISVEQTGPEEVPLRVSVPVKAIIQNMDRLRVYRGHKDRFPVLQERGIPTDLDWEAVVTEMLLPYARQTCGHIAVDGYIVDRVEGVEFEGETLSLDCICSDPSWDHI